MDNSKLKEKILESLKEVIDPELGFDVVSLGLIYEVEVKGEQVLIKMTLTSAGCPLSGFLLEGVKKAASGVKGVNKVDVDLIFEPLWTPDRASLEVKKALGLE
jgi:metal-sulfur cluster biosynthetic enzyme